MPPFHLPTSLRNADVQIFTTYDDSTGATFATYNLPKGKSSIYIYALSAGGGGGGGFTRAAAAAGGGGGGGGTGGLATLLIPACFVPDTLFIRVGVGGAGGAAGVAGSTGRESLISIYPTSTVAVSNYLLRASNGGGGGGGAGTGAAAGAAGTAAATSSVGGSNLTGNGIANFFAGQAGTAGGAASNTPGTANTFPTTGINVMGGTGGGGVLNTDQAGGAITAVTSSYISENRPQGALAGSNSGPGGFSLNNGLFYYPGLGGASSNAGVGGNGGNGGFGCGGGGGGAGTTGGTGGRGGDGLVVIIAW